jgi:PEP-CTERM/exosortase A-associated glycosyltransferase
MKILHVFDHSVPLQSGYTFRSLAILRAQHARGWRTAQMTTPRHGAATAMDETVDGLVFHRSTLAARPTGALPGIGEWFEMRQTARRMDALVATERPDILHAHSPVLNALPAIRVGRRRGIPVVYEVRAFWEDAAASHGTSQPGGLRYAATKALETYALRRADAITTICEGLRDDMIARGLPVERITVIPNAVDLDRFPDSVPRDTALAARLGLEGATVLGFIGSFYGYEGLEFLVRAMPAVLQRRPDVRLLLVGGGPEAERVKALVAELGLAEAVRQPGRVPHDQVNAYYGLVDIFVYPRLRMRLTETVTPLKPLEAMAQGRLVLASDVGGHRELIEHGVTGTLFRAEDTQGLVEAVDTLLRERASWPAMARRARAFVEAERTWPASVARYAPVYEGLVSRRRGV